MCHSVCIAQVSHPYKRVLHIITYSNFPAPSSPLFRMLIIPKLQDIYGFQSAMFMCKAGHNLLAMSCKQHVTCTKVKHLYELRKMRQFKELHFRTNVRKRSTAISGPFIWNSVPLVIGESDTLPILKKSYLGFIVKNYI